MGFEHLYGRIVAATLGTLLGVCELLAGAKFIRNRAKLISLLVKAQGALFAVLMGGVAATTMITASVKDPPTNQMQHVGFPRLMPRVQLRSGNGQSQITETNVADGYRVVATREVATRTRRGLHHTAGRSRGATESLMESLFFPKASCA